MPTRRAPSIAVLLVAALALVVSACQGSDSTSSPKPYAYLVGDSIPNQANEQWQAMMRADGRWRPIQSTLSGSSPCALLHVVDDTERDYDPAVAFISFSGNALFPCMRRPDGSALSPAEYRQRYFDDTEAMIRRLGPATRIYLVSAPTMQDHAEATVTGVYRELAAKHENVTFVDGGRLISPNDTWTATMPCLPDEPECTGPVIDGTRSNLVRAPDGVHLCPVANPLDTPCPVYSSGGWRFARTMVDALPGR